MAPCSSEGRLSVNVDDRANTILPCFGGTEDTQHETELSLTTSRWPCYLVKLTVHV